MRYRLGRIGVLSCLVFAVVTAVAREPAMDKALGKGLVLNYNFDKGEGAKDCSGMENDGVLKSATVTPKGRFGNGCALTGGSAHIRVASSKSLALDAAVTVSAWVNLRSLGPRGYGNEHGYIVSRGCSIWWSPSFSLGFDKHSGRPRFKVINVKQTKAGNHGGQVYSAIPLQPNCWTHLLGSYDGTEVRIYVNGCLEATASYAGKLQEKTAPVLIGGSHLNSVEFGSHFTVDGTVDNVMIWNRGLSDFEARSLYLGVPLKTLRAMANAKVDQVLLPRGETIKGSLAEENLSIALPYGKAVIPLADVRSIAPFDSDRGLYRIICAGGARFTGTLKRKELAFTPTGAAPVKTAIKKVLWLTRPVKARGRIGSATLHLRNGDRVMGNFKTTPLQLRTNAGEITVQPEELVSMTRVHGKPKTVNIVTKTGAKKEAVLVSETLTVKLGSKGAQVDVRVDELLAIRPTVKPPPKMAEVERLVKQLGADSFRERKAATRALIEMGKGVIKILDTLEIVDDPEIRSRIVKIKKVLAVE